MLNNLKKEMTKSSLVLEEMFDAAKVRCKIPNANNGRAYMGCVILDNKYCPLRVWVQQV
jgi:hypothetical protein